MGSAPALSVAIGLRDMDTSRGGNCFGSVSHRISLKANVDLFANIATLQSTRSKESPAFLESASILNLSGGRL